jgi:hypothetical protein
MPKFIQFDVIGVLNSSCPLHNEERWLLSTFDNRTYWAFNPQKSKFEVIQILTPIELGPPPKYDLTLKRFPKCPT